jgi:hypothetical protein
VFLDVKKVPILMKKPYFIRVYRPAKKVPSDRQKKYLATRKKSTYFDEKALFYKGLSTGKKST